LKKRCVAAVVRLVQTRAQAFAGLDKTSKKQLVAAWTSESKLRAEIHVTEAEICYEAEERVLMHCELLHVSDEAKTELAKQRELNREAGKERRAAEKQHKAAVAAEKAEAHAAAAVVEVQRSERHSRAAYTSHGEMMMMDWR
jgi:hypothetical protein